MGHYPRTDVSQDENGLLIESTVPGLSISDIQLELVGSSLIISGKNKQRNQHSKYLTKELYPGYFTRTYMINTKLFDTTKITSKIINGFLTIRIPYKDVSIGNKVKVINIEVKENGSK